MRLTKLAHIYLGRAVRRGDLAIDATMGNGYDTCFLARQVSVTGRVIAFDVQQAALDATRERLAGMHFQQRVTLLHTGHENLATHLPAAASRTVAGVAFNLGYLPGGDKRLTTKPETTIQALSQAIAALRVGGMLTVLVYVGHDNGAAEYKALVDWLANRIGPGYELIINRGESANSPTLYVIERKS